MPKVITNEQRDLIIELHGLGAQTNTISRATGASTSTVRGIIQLYTAVDKEEDHEWLSMFLSSWKGSRAAFTWACEKLGKDPDEVINRVNFFRNLAEEQPCEQDDEDATPVIERQPQTTPFYIQQMLLNEAKIIELLTQLCDTVIPTHMKILREDNERNTNIVCERMKLETDAIVTMMADTNKYLDNIRYYTRDNKRR